MEKIVLFQLSSSFPMKSDGKSMRFGIQTYDDAFVFLYKRITPYQSVRLVFIIFCYANDRYIEAPGLQYAFSDFEMDFIAINDDHIRICPLSVIESP